MTIGLVIKETMSGWLQLDDGTRHDFAFSIQAFTPKVFRLSAPRAFRGEATLAGQSMPCQGELTLYTHGPHYWVDFEHPSLGRLRAEGKKTYSMKNLVTSLTTCPMEIFQHGKRVGEAEVAYRDSMLAFPFSALRLVSEENAFGQYGEV